MITPPALQPATPMSAWGTPQMRINLPNQTTTVGGTAPGYTSMGGYGSPYGGYTSPTAQKWGQGLGFAQAGIGLIGTLMSIKENRDRFKFNKKNTRGNFNAGALVYNNTLTDRQNGLDRYNEYHGTNYAPTNQLSYMSEWGKPQNQPSQTEFDRSERGAAQQDPRRYG